MRKTFIIVCTLLFCLPALSGSKEIELSKVQNRNGVFYEPNQEKPYTGKAVNCYKNGQKRLEFNFKDGKRDGLNISWYENGQKRTETTYKNDKQDGLDISWYENGQKMQESNFKDGKRDGLNISWYENGKKKGEEIYKNGKLEIVSDRTRKANKVFKSVSPSPTPKPPTEALPMVVEVKTPNAKLVNYKIDSHEYCLLLPDNISEYKYLSKYPLTAFLFVTWFNETELDQLPVKTLMGGSLYPGLYFRDVLAFEKIEGFQGTADSIKNLDEFNMSIKKNEVIAKLKECYRNYSEEYKKYLRGINGYYVFRNGKIPSSKTEDGRVTRDNYKFDDQTITLELLGNRALSHNESGTIETWEKYYLSKFYRLEGGTSWPSGSPYGPEKNLSREITIPMAMDDAKKLFGAEQEAFCQTLLAVRPKSGWIGYKGGNISLRVTKFEILKIGKTCFRKDTGFESPVLMFEIASTPDRPLY